MKNEAILFQPPWFASYSQGLRQAHIALGKALYALHAPKKPLLVIGDAGAVPYYSQWETVDSLGLNDPVLARDKSRINDYILRQHPDLVVLLSTQAQVFQPEAELGKDAVSRMPGTAHAVAGGHPLRPGLLSLGDG